MLLPVERTKQPFTHYRYASPAGGGRCAIADIRLHAVDAVVSGTWYLRTTARALLAWCCPLSGLHSVCIVAPCQMLCRHVERMPVCVSALSLLV